MEGYFKNYVSKYSDIFIFFDIIPLAEIPICNKCKDSCSSCSSLECCTSCVPGTYGQSCENPCDSNCKNTACNLTTGICENGCSSGYYTNGTTCESCSMCDDCRTESCKSSCCQATTPPICSVENCDVCSEIDIGLCKDCLDGYRVTGNGSCESNAGLLTSDSSKEDDDDIVIGVAIGSVIFVLTLVAGIVVAMFITKRKRFRQKFGNQTETGEHIYLNEAVQGSSRNTEAKNNVGNSENISGESRSEINTTLRNSDDIDQHEYEYVENPGSVVVEHVYLNDAVGESSRNADGKAPKIGGHFGNISGAFKSKMNTTSTNNDDIDQHEYQYVGIPEKLNQNNTDVKNNVGNSGNISSESRSEINATLTNSDDIDQHEFEYVDNPRYHGYLNDPVRESSRNTDGKAPEIDGHFGNISGASQSKMNTTSTNNDDIDQHEYEYVANQDQRTVDYESLRPLTRDEHVYRVAEESAYIN